MPPKLGVGERIDLTNYYENISRRSLLKSSARALTASAGISSLVTEAYGAEPEGKTIVHTRDKQGRPAKVRVIEEERYRRLKVYSQYPVSKIQSNPHTHGLSITQRSSDPTELALQFLVDEKSDGEALPDSIENVPVEYVVEQGEAQPQDVEGGVDAARSDSTTGGTVMTVCYEEGSNDKVILTAHHVMEGWDKMYSNGDHIGWYAYSDPRDNGNGMDATAYNLVDGTDHHTLGTIEILDITGYWTFSGLSDATSWGNKVDADGYGSVNGHVTNKARNTSKGDKMSHQVGYKKNYLPTSAGDSGMPWIDTDGYLISHHHGYREQDATNDKWVIGGVAEQLLDSVYANLDTDGTYPSK